MEVTMHWIIIISFFTAVHGPDVTNVQHQVYPKSFDTPAECTYWRDLLLAENKKAYGEQNAKVDCYGLESGVFER